MRKSLSIFLVIITLLTACGAPPGTAKPHPTLSAAQKTPGATETVEAVGTAVETASRLQVREDALKGMEITAWIPWFGLESSLFNAMVDDFNGTNEWGIKVSAESQVNFSYLYENVMASLPTRARPDVVVALPEHALGWAANDVLAELTPYVEDPLYGIDSGDFASVFWDQDKSGGQRVAIPAQRTARVLLWNETWAGELGFDLPPASPDKFRQQACRAHQSMKSDDTPANDGKGGWVLDTKPMTAYAWLLAFEGGVLEGNDYRFLTPNNIKAFEFLKGLTEENCAWQAPANVDPVTDFATRQALFITAGLEDLPTISRAFAAAGNTDKWTALSFPGENEDALVVYGSSYAVLKSTPEAQLAAWIFIRWMLEPEQDARWVETTHLFPLRSSTLSLLGDYQGSHPQWEEAVNLLPQGELQPQLASWRTVKVMLGDGFSDMFRQTDLTSGQVAKVLAQMESTARELGD